MRALPLTFVALLGSAGLIAAGCGGNPAPAVDEIVNVARRAPLPKPPPPTSFGRVRPSRTLPNAVSQAPSDSDLVMHFVACEALGFYVQNGYLPTADDWAGIYGGYMLSRIPVYQARQLAGQLSEITQSTDPVAAAVQTWQALGCTTR